MSLFISNDNKQQPFRTEDLFDVNENKEYGYFIREGNEKEPTERLFLNTWCKSEAQWILLVKPYYGREVIVSTC